MKKSTTLMMLSAMTVLAGCRMQEAREAAEAGSESPAVHFVARTDALTRTSFGTPDGTVYPIFWTGNETVGISLNYGEQENVGVSVNEARTVAEFDYVPSGGETSYTFFAVTPSSALDRPSESRGALRITVPSEQKPLAGSVDEAAQVFYAKTGTTAEKPGARRSCTTGSTRRSG